MWDVIIRVKWSADKRSSDAFPLHETLMLGYVIGKVVTIDRKPFNEMQGFLGIRLYERMNALGEGETTEKSKECSYSGICLKGSLGLWQSR
jgi:hypothetical protein